MTTEEAQAKLDALIAEKSELAQSIETMEAELKAKQERLTALGSGWRSLGEIEEARRAVRDSAFPILEAARPDCFFENRRIIAVSEKVITIREDTCDADDVKKYSRATGMPPNSKYGSKIDVEKALKIWSDHQAKLATT